MPTILPNAILACLLRVLLVQLATNSRVTEGARKHLRHRFKNKQKWLMLKDLYFTKALTMVPLGQATCPGTHPADVATSDNSALQVLIIADEYPAQ